MNKEIKEKIEDIFEIIGNFLAVIVFILLAITVILGLIKLCLLIWTV